MPAINITAAELRVGDMLHGGAKITEVREHTIPGYEVKSIRIVDDKMRYPCVAAHFEPHQVLTVLREA